MLVVSAQKLEQKMLKINMREEKMKSVRTLSAINYWLTNSLITFSQTLIDNMQKVSTYQVSNVDQVGIELWRMHIQNEEKQLDQQLKFLGNINTN